MEHTLTSQSFTFQLFFFSLLQQHIGHVKTLSWLKCCFFHEPVHTVASLSVCRLRSKIVRVEGLHLMITLLAPH